MNKEKKFIIGLIFILLILTFNKPIISLEIINDPDPPNKQTKGELNITISQDNLDILIGDKKTIEINLIAKDGNIPNFNLTLMLKNQTNDENRDLTWIEIEYNEKVYKLNENIYFDKLEKNESKSL
ncbi:MAG: hypothetical protein H5U37_08155, partial [Caldisericia bacterium]|nr:hypothetical protein [Caldisericia bacterium]